MVSRDILIRLESIPSLFSLVHFAVDGKDINRRAFVNLISRGHTVVEVGANIGNYTRLFARLVGNKGHVHAFEPVRDNFSRLTSQLSDSTNVSLNQMGVGNTEGEQEILIPSNDAQQSSFAAHTIGSWATTDQIRRELVRVVSIDSYLRRNDVDRVNFMKIDVEGSELKVLEGAKECLSGYRPVIHLEINSDWLKDFMTSPGEIISFLMKHGYRFFYAISPSSIRGYKKLVGEELDQLRIKPSAGDFICSVWPLKLTDLPATLRI
jgi:FkbM family methyltransferase